MRRRIACVLLALGVLISLEPGAAQQSVGGGANVNVISGTGREGDWTLQRQNEPSLACSSRNPRNCLAGANDYRTVDIPFPQSGDKITGDAWLGWYTTKDGGLVWRTRLLPGFPQDTTPVGLASPLKGYGAGADPVIRAGTNGLFYYTGLVFERTEAGASAVFVARFIDNNNQEGSDGEPIAYVGATLVDRIGIPQNVLARRGGARGGTSRRMARQTPPKPGATNASSIISGAAQSINSSIVDKPWIAVDIPRAGAQTCTIGGPDTGIPRQTFPGGRVFLVYTRFDTPDEQRGRIMFSRSLDCGATWSPPRVLSRIPSADVNNDGMSTTADVTALQASLGRSCGQSGFNSDADVNNDCIVNTFDLNFVARGVGLPVPTQPQLSQGATIAVDPRNGALQVAWRQFRDGTLGDAIVVARSADGGATFSAPAVVANVNPFDQGTTDTSFRTNGFPTLAIDGQGRRYLAWTSRGFALQRPDVQTGDARVVLSTSTDGVSWSAPAAVDNQPEPGHQIMPALAFAEGKLQLVYYDLREDISKLFGPFVDELPILNGPAPRVRHTMEVRAAQANPGPTPVFESFRLTRYQFGSLPNSQVVQQLEFNPPNLPIFRAGTSPFMGDYLDAASSAPFVRNGTTWAFNTAPSSSPVFHAIWTDNRDVSPPANGDWTDYTPPNPPFQRPLTSGFDPSLPTPLPACVPGQAGMRNQNIYTTRITQGLLVGALTNAKRLGTIQRSFPVFAQNNSTTVRSYRFTISNQPPGGEASFLQFSLLTALDVQVPPKSTVARTVFVRSSDPAAQIRVSVNEIIAPGGNVVPNGQQGVIVLNPDPTNPDIANPDIANPDIANPDIANAEVTNPDIANPDIANPDIANPDIANPDIANPDIANVTIVNPDIANPDIANPDIANPDIANPDIANPDIANTDLINGSLSDTTWTFQNKGNTGGSFTIKLALNRAVPAGFKTQLIAHKVYQTPAALGCVLLTQPQTVLLSNIPNPTFVTANELANPDIANPDIANLTIALGPGETARITLRTLDPDRTDAVTFRPAESVVTAVVAQAVNTEQVQQGITQPTVAAVLTTEAPASGGSVNGNYSTTLQAFGDGTWTLEGGNFPPGLTLNATTGEITGTPTASGVFTFTLKFTATSGLIDYKTVTINISSTGGADLQLSAPAPVPVPVGSDLVYTINAGNAGPDTATNVVLTDTLPEGVTFLSATTTRGSCLGKNGSVVCNLGTLLASETATIVITVKPNTTGPHVNSVQLTAAQADPVIANNVTSTTTSSPAFGPCAAPCFSGPTSFSATAGNGGFLMEMADFNEDGIIDLVYSSATGNIVAVLRGDGAGGFLAPQQVTTPGTPQAVAVGDFNGDNNVDLFVGAASGTNAWLFLGDGSGGFGSAITVDAGVAAFHPVPADFNRDGNLDIVAGGTQATNITTLLLGNGDGTFAAPTTIHTGAAGPVNVVVEDFNSDGNPDVALSNRSGTTIAVLLGTGAGDFATTTISIGASPRVRKVGDLTGDGVIDLLVVDSPSANVQRTQLLAGNGVGGFAAPVNINADAAAFYAASGDIDGDGDLDLVGIRVGAGFTVQVNDGSGGFGTPILWPSPVGGHVVIGDFNQDGAPDVAIAGTTPSRVLVFLNTCSNPPADLTLFQIDAPDPVTAGGNVTYSLTVVNNGPNQATNVQVSDALGTGAANATFVSATPSQGSCTHNGGLVVCQLGTLQNSSSATIQIVVTANGTGTLSNVVGVTAATSDPNPADNTRTSATVVNGEVAPLVVINTNDSGPGSLRQAITNANATGGPADTITFNIPGPGPHTIALASALPTVSQPAIIDATTQPGYSGTPLVELSGANLGTASGLVLTGGSTVRGLAINRFNGTGIILQGSGGNVVQASRIGTNPAGTTALANNRGIYIFESPNNTIGGNTANDRNLLSGNNAEGIVVEGAASTNNLIQGNFVGTDAAGTAALGNGVLGIALVGASNNTIGGTSSGQFNVIAFNAGTGVLISTGTGNLIAGNRIFSNGSLGIDLGEGGVTPNDLGDGDAGANNLQNFPVLAATAGGVQGTLNSTASRTFRIEFFGNSACDASGNGEGATFLGSTTVSTNTDGIATIPFFAVGAGQIVTATATDTTNNNTSEFSACVTPTSAVHTWISDASGFWEDPANWSGNQVPVDGDIVVIDRPAANPTITVQSAVVSLAGFRSEEPLVVTGGTLTFTGLGELKGGLTMSGGVLTGSGDLTFGGNSLWTGGNITGTGAMTVLAGATLSVQSPNQLGVLVRSITNHGVLVWNQAELSLTSGAQIANRVGGVFEIQSNLSIVNNSQVPLTLTNEGTLTKTGPQGAIALSGVNFVTSGTVSLRVGSPTDAIVSDANGTLGGTLLVGLQDSFVPAPASTFDMFSFASRSGTFSVINGGAHTYAPTYTATGLTLTTEAAVSADVALAKADAPDPVVQASPLTYTLTVTNNGPDAATDVTVTDTLPSTVTFVSATPSQGSCTGTATVSCSLGAIANGASATITIVVTPTTAGGLTNTATVSAAEADPVSGNNTASTTTVVTNPAAIFTVTTTANAGPGSLRQAILDANANSGGAIVFNIEAQGVQTISPTSALPNLTAPISIDGTSQPGFSGVPLIEISGTLAGTANGLVVAADNVLIRGLIINGFASANGISLQSGNGTRIEGNYLGTNASGNSAAGNANGIVIQSSGATIGGLTASARNVLSGNSISGVQIVGHANVVQGNLIGTNAAGSGPVANGQSGVIVVGDDNVIGGTTPQARNVISGNVLRGVVLGNGASGNLIQGNGIGTDPAGTAGIPNGIGIVVGVNPESTASSNTIGGTQAGAANVIAFNTGIGVWVGDGSTNNAILRNTIFSNGALGIDLNADDVTPNDFQDEDGGANDRQNFPVLTAVAGGVQGTLNSTPNSQFRIEFFSSPSCDASGQGEGALFLGATLVTTNPAGDATIPFFEVGPNQFVTATATDGSNNTSEFSACVGVSTGTPVVSLVNPASAQQGQTLNVVVTGENTNFVNGTTTASFGAGIVVNSTTVTSPTQATVNITISPIATTGSRTVTMNTGNESAQSVDAASFFAVTAGPAAISGLSPNTGQQNQTLDVVITGSNTHFAQGTSGASFGSGITVNSLTVGSSTLATANITVAAGAALGARTVTVTTAGETATIVNGFTVQTGQASISNVSPNTGRQAQRLDVTVTGSLTGFIQGTTTANFGPGITTNSVTVTNATTATVNITIAVGASLGSRTVTMTTGSEVASLPGGFTVLAGVATITELTPTAGTQGQNLTVIITGAFTNFTQGVTVANFGPGISVGSVTVNGPTLASVPIAISAGATVGLRTVTLTTGTESASITNGFNVLQGTPTVTSINPNVGRQNQTLPVVINGLFTTWTTGTTRVSFGAGISVGGAAAGTLGPVAVQSSTQLTANLEIDAAAALGVRDVTIETGAEVIVVNGGFTISTVDTTNPSVLIFSPAHGATDVPLNAEITVEFNEPMDRNSITPTTMRLLDNITGQVLPSAISVDPTGRIATLVPAVLMAVNRSHQLALTGGASGIKDQSGNPLGGQSAFFTTGFNTNTAGPAVLFVNPRNGDSGVPLNTRVSAQFDKPINPVTRPAGFRVTQGGVNVPGTYAFSDNNRRITFTPAADLVASTSYAINITAALSDAAGNQLSNPQVVPFTTGTAIDSIRPQSDAQNPESGETNVPTNVVVRLFFNEPVNPMTVTAANFRLFAWPTSQIQPATVLVSPDRRSATLTPIEPLRADTTYFAQLSGSYEDIAGNVGFTVGNIFFTTGGAVDNTPPAVIQVTPTPSATNVPVNSRLVLQLSEPLDDASVALGTLQLTPSVAGTLTVDEVTNNNVPIVTVTFVPSSNLAPSTLYTVQVSGWRDRSGNQMAPFSTTFTTSASATADTTAPIATVQPANNATNVPQNAQIQITVNEPIVPATITPDSIFIRQESGSFARMAGTFSVNATATVITFTPAQPYPAGSPISVRVNSNGAIRDLAGNQLGFVFSQFTVDSAITDTVGPTVTSITPADGTVDTGANPLVVLTFSESLNPSTVNANTFSIFTGANRLSTSPQLSADNRTVVLSGLTLPQNTIISVVATSDVTDLAGNPLADFHSTFTTGTAIEADRPSIVVQRPASGATGVPTATTITLYANSPLDPATVPGAVRVSQNGILVEGVATVSASGEAIHFVPAGAFTAGALVQIFVDDTATDVQGNPLFPYSGQLTIQSDPLTLPPQVLAISPFHGQTGVPTNVVVEVRFSEPLDPSTVNVANISLRNNQSDVVPSTITLIDGGRTVRLVPSSPLAPNQSFHVSVLTGLEDAQNTPIAFTQSFFFNTGAVTDTVAPTVTAIMPPANETGVGANALLRLTFSEAINRVSVRGSTVKLSGGSFTSMPASISFSTGVGGVDVVTISPLEPLPENTVFTIDVNGVTDLAGRAVVPFSSQFTTGADADTDRPFVAAVSFPNGAVDVPLNAVFTVEMSEPIDGQTMTVDGFRLFDHTIGTNVTATRTLSADGRTLTLAPSGPLAAGRGFSLILNSLEDMAGNTMFGTSFFFTTTFTPDTNPPTVVATTPSSGATGVPRNATLAIRFSEPIASVTSGVRLLRGATPVSVTYVMSDVNRVLELVPATLLAGSTGYTLSIQGVRDQSGNVLAGTVNVPFTTAGGADLVVPVVVATNPQSGDTDVPRNVVLRATFSERINPLSPGIANWRLFHSASGQTVPATRAVSSDLRTVTLTPLEPLLPSTAYNGSSFQVEDLAGNPVGAFIGSFTTGNDVDNTAPSVQSISPVSSLTSVPVNARVVAVFNEKIDRTSIAAGSVALTPLVPGSFTLAADERTLTFTPSVNLAPSTNYTVQIAGFRDRVGTVMTPFASTFTTTAAATPDTTAPTVTSTSPANNASGVPVTSTIVINLSERIDAATVDADSIFIRQEVSPFGRIAGTYSVNGAGTQIVFTPAGPYPAATTITARINNNGAIKDVAGNTLGFSFLTFTTANTVDDAPPTVLSITPADGTTNVGTHQAITLVFSESLNPNTVNTESFAVFAGAQHIAASVQLSSDTRVVTLFATLPSTSSIAVAVTDGVEDLSGNPVTPFLSEFQTGLDTESSIPFITSQRPASGASNVPVGSSIVLFASEPLDAATPAAAVHVTQNGIPITGSVQVSGGGRAIHFMPSTPFAQGALIGITVDSNAKDLFGNGLSTYVGSFAMENDVALAPAVEFTSPAHGSTSVPTNTIIDIRFSEPMNPATLTASTITLRNQSGVEVPTTITVLDGNRRVRLDPGSNLSATATYFIQVTTGVQDAQGTAFPFTQNMFFTTGAAADGAAPTIVRVSPPNGTTGVGANAVVRVAFSEPINGATVTDATITLSGGPFTAMVSNVAFNTSFTEVVITPLQPLPSNTTLSLAINGVQDLAGNSVAPQTTTFQTGDGVDSDRPTPTLGFINGVANMPLNASFTVTFNEPIVPQSVTETGLFLRDQTTGLNVAATISFSSDLRRITLVPTTNLTANRGYSLFVNSIQDLAANVMFGTSASFVTGSVTDTTAPTVVAISPPGGGVPTPINAAIQLWFSEAIRPVDLGALTLRNGSTVLPLISATMSSNNRLLTITPSTLLRRSTSYTLDLLSAGVMDTAGNPIAGPVQSFTFSTNNSADVKRPSITGTTPTNGAINLPTTVQPTITFSEAMNPVVIHALAGTGSGIRLQVNATGVDVPVTFAFSANFRTVTVIPLAPLAPNTQYVLRINTAIQDLAGNFLNSFVQVLFTTQP